MKNPVHPGKALRDEVHWLPLLVWCISGSRCPAAFFVDDGVARCQPRLAQTSINQWFLSPGVHVA